MKTYEQEKIYIKFYKPDGVLSSFSDSENRKTLREFIPYPNIYAAGRLDMDSEGLMLLTNDGWLNHQVTFPKTHLKKSYLVQVEGLITQQALVDLSLGPVIKGGYKTLRCEVERISKPAVMPRSKEITPHHETDWLKIQIVEGKKRQIRHMTAAVGYPTLRLIRVAIGPLELGDLSPGQFRDLSLKELNLIKSQLVRKVIRE
ncbi:MAG: hypothetical protein BGO78_16415 [Chloroflexi bacterium 44-23]|nr:MAG: hypothetical protein BGO78_16415 [Chloroflexi bacterium 44-23]